MNVRDLDQHESGNKPITNCLRWLRTCLASCVSWSPEQRSAAEQSLREAEEVLAMELSPNAGPESLVSASLPLKREDSPLRKMVGQDVLPPGTHVKLSPDDVSRLVFFESALFDKVEAMRVIMSKINVRIAFIDWPAETFWNAGTADRPHWVPDWRREMMEINAAINGLPFSAQSLLSLADRETLPWNRIPEEHRPSHVAQGMRRLNELHLAWVRYREDDAEDGVNYVEMKRLLKLKESMQRAFEKAPHPGGSLTLHSSQRNPAAAHP